MTPNTIYIALGTNLGQREANLRAARKAFPPAIQILEQSPIYQTEPWGYTDQPDFLNQALLAEDRFQWQPASLLAQHI